MYLSCCCNEFSRWDSQPMLYRLCASRTRILTLTIVPLTSPPLMARGFGSATKPEYLGSPDTTTMG